MEEGSPRAHICEMTPGKKAYLRTAAALIIAYTLGASVPFQYFWHPSNGGKHLHQPDCLAPNSD
jgi:hypothetical protein